MSLSSTGSPAVGCKASDHVSIYDSSVEGQPVHVGRETSVSGYPVALRPGDKAQFLPYL